MATFSWASAADLGLGLISGYAQGRAAKATASAENAIREANNSVARSSSMFARTLQTINNRRILEAAGKNVNALTQASSAMRDQQTRSGFEASIRNAEAIGAAASTAAASGITGGNLGILTSVQEMAVARSNEYRKVDNRRALDNHNSQIASIMGDSIRSLDNSPLVAQQDFTQSSSQGMMGFLMSGLMGKMGSAQTLLGSLAPDPANPAGVVTKPVYRGSVVGTDLPPLEPLSGTGAVRSGSAVGTFLPPMTSSIRIN